MTKTMENRLKQLESHPKKTREKVFLVRYEDHPADVYDGGRTLSPTEIAELEKTFDVGIFLVVYDEKDISE